jgi:hypothetical protein
MADFSKAEFDAVIADIHIGMADFAGKLDQMIPVATAAVDHWYVPADVQYAILWLARKTVEIGSQLVIATAIATLTAFLGTQATSMISLHGEAVDVSKFPDGRWPRSNTSTYGDATVTDGDADWSLAQ